MKINLDAVLKDQFGADVIHDNMPTSLGFFVCQALLAEFKDEPVDGNEKHLRYKLWGRLKNGGAQDMTVEEAAKLKRLIGIGWAPLIVGQCWDLLEGVAQ